MHPQGIMPQNFSSLGLDVLGELGKKQANTCTDFRYWILCHFELYNYEAIYLYTRGRLLINLNADVSSDIFYDKLSKYEN